MSSDAKLGLLGHRVRRPLLEPSCVVTEASFQRVAVRSRDAMMNVGSVM